jgi:membrane protein insertase Oxa1/YidC/SpoIIIJ
MMNPATLKMVQSSFALVYIPFMAFMPAAMNIYYLASMGIGVVQAYVLRHPKVRVAMGLPAKVGASRALAAAALAQHQQGTGAAGGINTAMPKQ